MEARVLNQIANDEMRAIALDTSIFVAQQGRLETGLLRRVEQFRDYPFEVLLVDVVQDELVRHLTDAAVQAQTDLRTALRKIRAEWRLSDRIRSRERPRR